MIAIVGVAYSLMTVGGKIAIANAISSSSGNEIAAALPQSSGLQTLRYTASTSFALALHQYLYGNRRTLITILNGVLLTFVVLMNSRLSLILCIVTFLYLSRRKIRLPARKLAIISVIGLALIFLITVPFNYVRNANFYEARGISSPFAMNASQIVAYLGAPTQVAVATADSWYRGALEPYRGSPIESVIPTYLSHSDAETSLTDFAQYPANVEIALQYNTNSAFAHSIVQSGLAGLLVMVLVCFIVSIGISVANASMSPLSLIAAPGLYGFSELWRVYLFNAGIIHFIALSVIFASVIARMRRKEGMVISVDEDPVA